MSTSFDAFVRALQDAELRVLERGTEQGPRVMIADRDDVILVELAWRDDDAPCYARTARFNVSARPLRRAGGLDAEGRSVIAKVIAIVERMEHELVPARPDRDDDRVEVREIRVTRALVREGDGRYYLDPYVGCLIGCPFCWVDGRADLGRALEGRAPRAWGRWVDVKIDLADVLRREVVELAPGPVRISPVVTDPYQPIERRYRITRACLEVLLDAGFTPIVLTRARRVLDDLALFERHRDRVAVGLSIPTDDDDVRRAFEPNADPIEERLDALRTLHDAGVTTFAVVQPVLPMRAARLIDAIAPHACAVRIDRMHEVKRALPVYARAGRLDAASDAFAEATIAELRAGFASAGVPIDERDDLASLVLDAIDDRARSLVLDPRRTV